jgi:quercetin dioxygenase-like cupin family protein
MSGVDDGRGIDVTVADLGQVPSGPDGAIWSLPHGGDLDANLVQLGPGRAIAEHVNDEVDVVVYVRNGAGEIVIDGEHHTLAPDVLVVVPRRASRGITAGAAGITYLSIHRGRGPLTIGSSQPDAG